LLSRAGIYRHRRALNQQAIRRYLHCVAAAVARPFVLQNRCSTAELIRPTARLLAFTRFRGGASTADTPRADLGVARAAD
jgi:hypothetical protein